MDLGYRRCRTLPKRHRDLPMAFVATLSPSFRRDFGGGGGGGIVRNTGPGPKPPCDGAFLGIDDAFESGVVLGARVLEGSVASRLFGVEERGLGAFDVRPGEVLQAFKTIQRTSLPSSGRGPARRLTLATSS